MAVEQLWLLDMYDYLLNTRKMYQEQKNQCSPFLSAFFLPPPSGFGWGEELVRHLIWIGVNAAGSEWIRWGLFCVAFCGISPFVYQFC